MKHPRNREWVRLLGFGAMLLLTACNSVRQENAPAETKPVSVKVITVRATPMDQLYEATGAVRARQRAVLASKLQATVLAVPVKLGDAVRPGQLLVELDHGETDAEASRAQATLEADENGVRQAEKAQESAQAEAHLAATTLARYQQLFDKKSVSPQELDQAKARNQSAAAGAEMAAAHVQQVRAQRESASAAFESARLRQGYTRITAPFAGFVAEKNADAGSVVSSGMPLLAVEDLSEYQLEVSLPESHLRKVKIGDPARVMIPAIQMDATARVVEMEAGANAAARASLVRTALPGSPELRSGLFGRALFSLGKADLLVVPNEAVQRQGQLTSVFVVAEGRARRRLVTLGREQDGQSEVLSGLTAGEQVVASLPGLLADGMAVEIQP